MYPFIYYYYDVTPKFQTNQYGRLFCGGKFSENPQSETRTHSSPDPSCGREISRGKTKNPFPQKNRFSFFRVRIEAPPPPRQIRNARSVFSFGVAGVFASAWGFLRAYDLVSSHHALRACLIICFGNRCEFGTIETPRIF